MAHYEAKEGEFTITAGASHYCFESGWSMEIWSPDKEKYDLHLEPGGPVLTIEPPRPLKNEYTKDILARVTCAIEKLETKNVPAEVIALPRKQYFTILTRKDFYDPGERYLDPGELKCKLFGKKLVCSENYFPDKKPRASVLAGDTFHEQPIWVSGAPYLNIKSRARPFWYETLAERRALGTLRDMISEREFRKYIKDGFLVVKGISGKSYQIFREKNHIKVWERGRRITEICVYLQDYKLPPTDKVIAFKVMIEAEEDELYRMGNVYNMRRAA